MPQVAPKRRHPRNPLTLLDSSWDPFSIYLCVFCLKRSVLKCDTFFLQFLGRPEPSAGWAHMQSVHAGAVQTQFCVFTFFAKIASRRLRFGSVLGTIFIKNYGFGWTKTVSKNGSKNGIPQDANGELFPGQEPPGQSASRARFLNKKQQSGQEATTAAHF